MLFPTVAFALFFVVAFCANWLLRPHHGVWRVAMVALSFFFYGWWNWRFCFLLALSIVGNWLFGHAVGAARIETTDDAGGTTTTLLASGRRTVKIAVAANLALLGVFKYYGFFATSFFNTFGIEDAPPFVEQIVLPVGISFFTFQAMSYVIDMGRGEFGRPLPLLDVAFYLSFFPQLVAGPIVRATDMAEQIRVAPDPRTIPFTEAFWLIGRGLFKKVVISSYLATTLVDPVFDVPAQQTGLDTLIAVYAYAIQIYADFSGYTDIAIGCALLLGFRFPTNFDAPYRALTIQDFWRRWHISLSSWLRDYLYIPLGGNRGGRLFTYRNLALTMVLGGLWHGANWTFIIWGVIHGGALALERFASEQIRSGAWQVPSIDPGLARFLKWFATFHVVCFAWVFFRADSFGLAVEVLGRIVGGGFGIDLITALVIIVIVVMMVSQFVNDLAVQRAIAAFGGWHPAAQIAVAALGLTVIDGLGPEGVAPFIYFQF